MTAPTAWRGDDGDTPRRTERVLRWYRLRLKSWFKEVGEKGKELEATGETTDPILYPDLLEGLTDWYAERPDEFLRWQPDDEFCGGWYQLGAWSLDVRAMKAALRRAVHEVEAEQRRRAFAALGPVTGDDVDAALALLHGSTPLTEEADADSLFAINDPRRTAYLVNKYNVRDRWPRACRRCGRDYKPTRRSQRVTCGECLAAARHSRSKVSTSKR